jgi:hypothetical protein
MKRRTKDKVGSWPNMRDDTLRAVCDELIRARKAHPSKLNNLHIFQKCAVSLHEELVFNQLGKISAVQIYARAAQVAAMAIRILEEGAENFAYAGNTAAPPFKLTPDERENRDGC